MLRCGQWLFNEFLWDALEKGLVVSRSPLEVVERGIKMAQGVWDRLMGGVSGDKLVVGVE